MEAELREALAASDMWLRMLVKLVDLNPDEFEATVKAVSAKTGSERQLAKVTLADRLRENEVLLRPVQ